MGITKGLHEWSVGTDCVVRGRKILQGNFEKLQNPRLQHDQGSGLEFGLTGLETLCRVLLVYQKKPDTQL